MLPQIDYSQAMNLLTATAEAVLSAPPESLVPHWPATASTARSLLHHWHPDRNADPNATAVFAHLQVVRRAWKARQRPLERVWTTSQGTFALRYLRQRPTAVGATWYGHAVLVDEVAAEAADLIAPAQALLKGLSFGTPAMAAQFRPMLPSPARHLTGSVHLLVRPRPPGMVRLAELLAHLGGALPPRHVAWIGSALWNLACYLEYAGVVHHDLSVETVWVHPEDHRIAVLDPWLYARPIGAALVAFPARTQRLAPQAYLDKRLSHFAMDHHLIRALLRELLGDATGMALDPSVPVPLATFVRLPASGTAQHQYAAWKAVLLASFGKPAFVPLAITPATLDPEK